MLLICRISFSANFLGLMAAFELQRRSESRAAAQLTEEWRPAVQMSGPIIPLGGKQGLVWVRPLCPSWQNPCLRFLAAETLWEKKKKKANWGSFRASQSADRITPCRPAAQRTALFWSHFFFFLLAQSGENDGRKVLLNVPVLKFWWGDDSEISVLSDLWLKSETDAANVPLRRLFNSAEDVIGPQQLPVWKSNWHVCECVCMCVF